MGTPEPLPNWRQVPGFPVFGVGQPTQEGLAKVKEVVGKDPVMWFNLRVEPVAYLEGLPVALRAEGALHTNIQVRPTAPPPRCLWPTLTPWRKSSSRS